MFVVMMAGAVIVGMPVVMVLRVIRVVAVIMPMIMWQMEGMGGLVGNLVVDVAQGRAGLFGSDAAVLVLGEDLGLAVG